MKWIARLILLPIFALPMLLTLLVEIASENCNLDYWKNYWGLK